jgi:putative spermidine/putrescine transport system substrate-binding protein
MISKANKVLGALGVAATLFAGAASMAQAETTVTYAGWGGSTSESVLKGLFADAEKLGFTVRDELSGGWAGIKAHLTSGAPGWDIADIGFARCEEASQAGLLMPVDYSIIDKSKIPAAFAQANYIGTYTFSYGLAYQKSKYGEAPQTWADFWDVAKFPGRRAMNSQGLYALEAALMADGVKPEEVYATLKAPGGVDRAFKKLEEIKPSVGVWWRSPADVMQLMRDGEVDMAVFPNGRAMSLAKEGADVGFVWNQAFLDITGWLLPKNAGDPAAAMKLIDSALDPVNQANFAVLSGYGPANPKAFDTGIISPELMAWMPTAPQNLALQVLVDPTWYASAEATAAYERFGKFIQ